MLRSVLRGERQIKRELRTMLDAVCVCASCGDEIQLHALQAKVHWCINTRLCVVCARQSSGLQLACSLFAHFNIETQICVCMCVGVHGGEHPSCSS